MAKLKALYFSHDSNARHDRRIMAVRHTYKVEGYGRYFILLEIMREEPGYKLGLDTETLKGIAAEFDCTIEDVEIFIRDCGSLFESDGEYIWSLSMLRRMQMMDEKSEKARASVGSRKDRQSDTNVQRTYNERNTDEPQTVNSKSPSGKSPSGKDKTLPSEESILCDSAEFDAFAPDPEPEGAVKVNPLDADFEEFWEAYAHKENRKGAEACYKRQRTQHSHEYIMVAVRNYVKVCTAIDRYKKGPSVFLGPGGHVDEWQDDGTAYLEGLKIMQSRRNGGNGKENPNYTYLKNRMAELQAEGAE